MRYSRIYLANNRLAPIPKIVVWTRCRRRPLFVIGPQRRAAPAEPYEVAVAWR